MTGSVRFGILYEATDESLLWELPWRSTITLDNRTTEIHPERSVSEIRPQFTALLEEGFVELYEVAGSTSPLPLADALAVIADEECWRVPAESGRNTAFFVALTQRGEAEYGRLAAER
jgi:hypothetical protein